MTKAKLRSNLWLAFNDVRLLLEPNMTSILALVIMTSYAEEYMTPSICWALVSRACTMLQALGITHWGLDSEARQRRKMLFWRLNLMDKSLAIVLGRPPTFHREMAKEIALPTLNQLLPCRPRQSSNDTATVFIAHYKNQMHLLSCVMGDAWYRLNGQGSGDTEAVKEDLETWYRQAKEVHGNHFTLYDVQR